MSQKNYLIRSPLYYAFLRFLSNKAALISGVILSIIILMSIFAPLITPTGYEEQKFLINNLAFPSWDHWFGIDDLGRDFYTRIIYGARVSLSIGFVAAAFSVFIGLPLGALAGYYGGTIDWFIMRIIELFSVIPPLMAALLLAALVKGGFLSIIFIAALFGWVQVCLLVRAQVLSFKEKEFIRSSFALGASPMYVIFKHLIPNSISPVIVGFLLGPKALGGMLGGALICCVMMALMMSNAGGAWDNAKKFVEKGNFGGKGSDVHKAAVVGDTVGDPLKDTSGPSMNILINVMAIVSLVIAPLLI